MTFPKNDRSALILSSKSPDLLTKLQENLGEPTDSYWNGSHTWFTEFGDIDLEWRLHPVSGFRMPEACRPEDLFDLALEGEIEIDHYWEGLEIFIISETSCTADELSEHVENILGIKPDHIGMVDHDSIGNEFERNSGNISIIELLTNQIKDTSSDS